jgi:hypothetical protein
MDNNELNNGLVDVKLDWWGDLIEEPNEYTSQWDMEIWELEKRRNRINEIL